MKKETLFSLAAGLSGLACLAAAGAWNNRAAQRMAAAAPAVELKNASPAIVFATVALGGFRGMLIDFLWLRAARLQERGEYFELAQLADWIAKLDPATAPVWAFHAWNMAYNIGYMFDAPEDRWRWVQNAIGLLRDQGLIHNPDDPEMYRELGWIFQHKIGGPFDEAHGYFKYRLASEMHSLLGGQSPDYASGPDSPAFALLRDKLKMSPEYMQQIDAAYGPLDWRLPESHSLYWAWVGAQKAETPAAAFGCERMICQALADMFRRGRLKFDPASGTYITSPDLRMLPKAESEFDRLVERHADSPMAKNAHASFLGEAVMSLFSFNRVGEAKRIFAKLRAAYPGPDAKLEFEEYIYEMLIRNVRAARHKTAASLVEGFLYRAFLWAGEGETELADGYNALAQLLWSRYMREIDRPYLAATTGLPPMSDLRARALERALADIADPAAAARLRIYAAPTGGPTAEIEK